MQVGADPRYRRPTAATAAATAPRRRGHAARRTQAAAMALADLRRPSARDPPGALGDGRARSPACSAAAVALPSAGRSSSASRRWPTGVALSACRPRTAGRRALLRRDVGRRPLRDLLQGRSSCVAAALADPAVARLPRAARLPAGGEFLALLLFATVGMMFMASGANLVDALRRARADGALGLRAGRLLPARGEVERGGGQVLRARRPLLGDPALRAVADLRRHRHAGPAAVPAEARRREARTLPSPLGIACWRCGFLFKVAAGPFHVWIPDVYEGAPTPVTAFMSVGPKAAAFAISCAVFAGGLGPAAGRTGAGCSWLPSALTMVWGNIAALTQDNVKRMLAYSSIAHAGYALLGLVAAGADAASRRCCSTCWSTPS